MLYRANVAQYITCSTKIYRTIWSYRKDHQETNFILDCTVHTLSQPFHLSFSVHVLSCQQSVGRSVRPLASLWEKKRLSQHLVFRGGKEEGMGIVVYVGSGPIRISLPRTHSNCGVPFPFDRPDIPHTVVHRRIVMQWKYIFLGLWLNRWNKCTVFLI